MKVCMSVCPSVYAFVCLPRVHACEYKHLACVRILQRRANNPAQYVAVGEMVLFCSGIPRASSLPIPLFSVFTHIPLYQTYLLSLQAGLIFYLFTHCQWQTWKLCRRKGREETNKYFTSLASIAMLFILPSYSAAQHVE